MDDQARFQSKNKAATMEAGRAGTEPDPRRWWALALLCGAFFMVILDAAIVTVAPPSIEKELDLSAQGLQCVVSAYALTFAGLLLLGGARGRRARPSPRLHGRRRHLHGGLAPLRARLVGHRADRRPRLSGHRRGDHDPERALDHHHHLRGGGRGNRALGIWEGLGGTEDGSDPLASTEAFQRLQDGICERCEEAPFVSDVELIGSYGLFGDGDENGP